MTNDAITIRKTSPRLLDFLNVELAKADKNEVLPIIFYRNLEPDLAHQVSTLVHCFRFLDLAIQTHDGMVKDSHEFLCQFNWAESLFLRQFLWDFSLGENRH
jgi:hypothetical protein